MGRLLQFWKGKNQRHPNLRLLHFKKLVLNARDHNSQLWNRGNRMINPAELILTLAITASLVRRLTCHVSEHYTQSVYQPTFHDTWDGNNIIKCILSTEKPSSLAHPRGFRGGLIFDSSGVRTWPERHIHGEDRTIVLTYKLGIPPHESLWKRITGGIRKLRVWDRPGSERKHNEKGQQ